MSLLVVAVDFDRCLIKDIPPLSTVYQFRPNAEKTINTLSDMGVEFVLNTSRYGWYYKSAVKFIRHTKIPIKIKRSRNKLRADVYIDDCNIFCKQINWYEIEKELLRLLDLKRKEENNVLCK